MIAALAALFAASVFFGGGLFQKGYTITGLVIGGCGTTCLGILFAAQETVIKRATQSLQALTEEVRTYNDDIDWMDW